jgi:hypothetical protein
MLTRKFFAGALSAATTLFVLSVPAFAALPDAGQGSTARNPSLPAGVTFLAAPQPNAPSTAAAPAPTADELATAQQGVISQPLNATTGISMTGTVTATWGGSGVRMTATHIVNNRASGTSGTLRLQLWATSTRPVFGNNVVFYPLGTYVVGTLAANHEYNNVDSGQVTYTPPPAGCYYITVALEEFVSGSYQYVDLATLSSGGTPDGAGSTRFAFGGATCSTSSSSCTRSSSRSCLLNGRFQVDVTYSSTSSGSGTAQVMYFGSARAESDESAFLWFFDSSNFEMGLKMLNACTLNGNFWVFISGLTDQGWQVNILDTQTGNSVSYSNDIGTLTPTTADTTALPCP